MNIESNKKTIPKIIHYVWVGGKPLTPLAKRCINSWKKYLPEYELKLWNEQSLPKEVLDHPYVQEMYQAKKWAFVSDYIRFWALKREGGVYLDTDTEVLRSFDSLLSHSAFFGKTKDGVIAAGVIGAVPEHQSINLMLSEYDRDVSRVGFETSPTVVTGVLNDKDFSDVSVYDYQYFNPCNDGERCSSDKLKLAYARNHWAESWVSYRIARKFARRLGLMRFIKNSLGKI